MTLPEEDRHIVARQYLEDSLCMRMGGRVAELLVYGDLSPAPPTTSSAIPNWRSAWSVSGHVQRDRPDGLGSNNQVFLGEDLMHTRDYSDHTSQVIDDEVERILREQESRAIEVLTLHRRGLEALTRALLEHETIDGETAARLIDEATVNRSTPRARRPSVHSPVWAPRRRRRRVRHRRRRSPRSHHRCPVGSRRPYRPSKPETTVIPPVWSAG